MIMSSIDLGNPQVLKNWLLCQMREGKGEFVYKEKVLVFRTADGSEYVAPPEISKDIEVIKKETGEKLMDSPEPEGSASQPKKKKKKIEV
jgi:hypothetical protein